MFNNVFVSTITSAFDVLFKRLNLFLYFAFNFSLANCYSNKYFNSSADNSEVSKCNSFISIDTFPFKIAKLRFKSLILLFWIFNLIKELIKIANVITNIKINIKINQEAESKTLIPKILTAIHWKKLKLSYANEGWNCFTIPKINKYTKRTKNKILIANQFIIVEVGKFFFLNAKPNQTNDRMVNIKKKTGIAIFN